MENVDLSTLLFFGAAILAVLNLTKIIGWVVKVVITMFVVAIIYGYYSGYINGDLTSYLQTFSNYF